MRKDDIQVGQEYAAACFTPRDERRPGGMGLSKVRVTGPAIPINRSFGARVYEWPIIWADPKRADTAQSADIICLWSEHEAARQERRDADIARNQAAMAEAAEASEWAKRLNARLEALGLPAQASETIRRTPRTLNVNADVLEVLIAMAARSTEAAR